MPEIIILILIFVALSGLLAMVDAAILSVTQAEAEEAAARKLYGGAALSALLRGQMRAVIVLVILTNTVNILGPILIGVRATYLLGNQIIGFLTAVLTALTILFSEIIPKAVGTHHAPLVARYSAPVIYAATLLFHPIVLAIEWIVRPFRRGVRPTGTEEQIRALATMGEGQGWIEPDERTLINRTFTLNDKRAEDIMVSVGSFASLSDRATIQSAAMYAAQWPHHRYPVLDAHGHAAGFVMSRELLQAVVAGRGTESVTTILHEPVLVPPDMRADDILQLLRDRRLHLAIVQADGNVLGIVTLKDVLEELVGEMRDERRI